MSMKEVAKKRILASFQLRAIKDDRDEKFNKFVIDLEDDPMLAAFKRVVMGKVRELIWNCCNPNVITSSIDIADGICRFGPDSCY
jgi:hypothetical protein